MLYEFKDFQLDPGLRELRLAGRDIALQPRVFDLLLFLVTHRDQLISKDELLSGVWRDAVVTEGSLKRAVSLLRAALRQGHCEDAIRTSPRQGYRFVVDDLREVVPGETRTLSEPLALARRALDEGNWAAAAAAFREADAADGLASSDLERWAEVEQCAGHPWNAIAPLERAVAAHSAAGDANGAARAALGLAHLHYERMEVSIGKGWLNRARSVLGDGDASRELGLWAAISSRFALADGDFDRALEHAERAIAIGRAIEDDDVELLGRNYLGMALIAVGDLPRGIAAHEEAATVVLTGTASPLISSLVYCGLIWTCRNRGDWERAGQWAASFSRWGEQTSLHGFAGTCRLHHAEVLHYRGELDEAEREAERACAVLAELAPYAQGDGSRVLGDLRLAQGDLDGAEDAYRRAHELGWDPQPGLAMVMLARGNPQAALRALERAVASSNWGHRQRRGFLLASLVELAVAARDERRAREALEELDRYLEEPRPTAMVAAALQARSAVFASNGEIARAIDAMNEATSLWNRIGACLEVGRNRMRLAELYLRDDDPEAAELELSAARAVLTRVGAVKLLAEIDTIAERARRT